MEKEREKKKEKEETWLTESQHSRRDFLKVVTARSLEVKDQDFQCHIDILAWTN